MPDDNTTAPKEPDGLRDRYVRLWNLDKEASQLRARLRDISATRRQISRECDALEAANGN